ncbi:MAG: Stp1/IreP family PP2C-type Ser/Thr phosphatase [Oligoflexia bacterium]|nr:Stp1/IreP family PP2C-type Ser/Thr phosphatase [Oligoflexia bacterium]
MTTESTETPSNPLSAIRNAAASDIGLRREENQDSHGIIETSGFKLFIVADGMGGVKGGGVASSLAINVLKECLEDKIELNPNAICSAVKHANAEIFEKGTSDPSLAGMGTTYVGLGFVGTTLFVSSVGDSRAYRVRDNNIVQLTTDHTLVQELLRSGAISPDQVENHPVSHMLTRSLGPTPEIDVDCFMCSDGPARGDIYILCSDGLYNLVRDHEMAQIVQDNYIDTAVQKLIKLANDRGGTDNITVIVVEVGEEFPVGPEAFEGISADIPVSNISTSAEPVRSGAGSHGSVEESDVAADASAPSAAAVEQEDVPVTLAVPVSEPANPELHSRVDLAQARPNEQLAASVAAAKVAEKPGAEQIAAKLVPSFSFEEWRSKPLPRALILGGAFTVVTLIGFVGGFYAPRILGGAVAPNAIQVVAPEVPQAQVAKVQPELVVDAAVKRPVSSALRLGLHDLPSLPAPDSSVVGSDSGNHDSGIAPEELSRLVRRRAALQQVVNELNDKIGAFDRPISSKLMDTLKSAREHREALQADQDELRSQIDVATRKLAVWYGRRKRLQSTDAINLANEVAVASPSVKEKKEVFELATWSYLKEAEVLRYNPSDASQDKKVAELAKARKDRQYELAEEVRRAIDKEVGDSDKSIAELTFKRDKILAEIENIRREEEYIRILMGSDPRAKDTKRQELARERDLAQAELNELARLLPDPSSPSTSSEARQGASTTSTNDSATSADVVVVQ